MKLAGGRQGWWAGWALGVLVFAACSGSDEGPPPTKKPSVGLKAGNAAGLDLPLLCADLAVNNGWTGGRCEKDGNGACGGVGLATSDCDHCCAEAAPASCAAVAKAKGWAGFACEQGDGACNGFGEGSSDCAVCCEAPTAKPTCMQVAAEWGYEKITCEVGGNGACQGAGPATSDCDHCCDAPVNEPPEATDDPEADVPAVENPFDEMDVTDDSEEGDDPDVTATAEDADVDDTAEAPAEALPIPCAELAAQSGWSNPKCEYDSNGACEGEGAGTTDCDHCCAGTEDAVQCGDGVCDGGETCDACAQDCGACLGVAEVNLAGITQKPELHQMSRALQTMRPMLVGLQNASSQQRRYLAQQLKLTHGQPSLQSNSAQTTHGLLAVAPLSEPASKPLPGGGSLLKATLQSKRGAFHLGSTVLPGNGTVAAAQAASALGGADALLAVQSGAPSSKAYGVLKQVLTDGWQKEWGPGLTTTERVDQIFRSGGWATTVGGDVVGPGSVALNSMGWAPELGDSVGSSDKGHHKSVVLKQPQLSCPAMGELPGLKHPVINDGFADPFIARNGCTFYAFATGQNVRRQASTDLVTWTSQGAALEDVPWKDKGWGFWAPAVYQARNGKWVMYFATQTNEPGKEQKCIGKAVSRTIDGTFKAGKKPLICPPSGWVIDPSVFRDPKTGRDYLLWRQDTKAQPRGNVFIRRLDRRGNLVGKTHKILSRSNDPSSWEHKDGNLSEGVLENPAMVKVKGTYHLFYSGNQWETKNYANGHAVCKTPFGPCKKTSGNKPWQGSQGKMVGPGGADLVRGADGVLYMYMHGYVESPGGPRKLWVFRLDFNGKTPKLSPL